MLTSEDPCAAATGPSQKGLRIAMLCLHTSPLRQPGQGDAGGMNVYVRHLASELARLGHAVDLITLWRDSEHPGQVRPVETVTAQPVGELPGLRLVNVTLPETASAAKDELPRHLPAVAAALRAAAAQLLPRPDVLHGHYWLSGEVGRDLAQDWDIPLALTLHTSARGKNAQAAAGESLEPEVRERAEQRLICETSALVVNTAAEAEQMR
ncbi:MAG: glycosyltransferase, partial [Micrococcales bacterium]|nr:glycosyltransferase [Micrococcales bacterium]